MRRGEVYWAELAPRSGAEQTGRRPVVVISHDGFNQVPTWRPVIVVPISTSAIQAQRGPTAVSLPPGAGGLPKASMALGHQITTLDRSKLTQRLGQLPDDVYRCGDGFTGGVGDALTLTGSKLGLLKNWSKP